MFDIIYIYLKGVTMEEFDLQTKQELEDLYQQFFQNPLILKMKEIPMHRGSNCYIHSFKVAKFAIRKALKRKNYHLKAVLIACILHDYYLYDWRVEHDKRKKHGRRHPFIAEANARRDFHIDKEVSDIIKAHMWPLTIRSYPKTKEAKLVNHADNVIATREFLTCKKYKKKKEVKYLKQIEKLFD